MSTILHQMEMIQRVAANNAVIAAYEESRKVAAAYKPPRYIFIGSPNSPTWRAKLETQAALYEAAMRVEGQPIRISELGVCIYEVRPADREALRNPETRRAAALKIKGELDAHRKPCTTPGRR
ncbi:MULTISPECIES: hypothetical protein [unclassified Rhizobium]|uniref:hypothetical protein n=1 Tax=unclassified Rhizobium TaxID=2613769 RepID=UPI0007E9CB55|nr:MULTISPECIES: hypothetical protein [unclassified Rhizobium]ANL12038.1 hypothetical protein AMJ98_PA00092 [Rhizobium sp. N1341]ANM42883.1 hypothetical protein AMK03_PA00092 [Rhizobium sp. N741]